ncbi:hypothetical protein M8C21_024267, partial [Ambrosia artemisiifolia]
HEYKHSITTTPTWEMPALATLNIRCLTLYDDNTTDKRTGLFSNCANLKNLTITDCRLVGGLNGFNICHPGLISLTLEDGWKRVNVDTPQLKNLTIKDWPRVHLISAPNLSSLHYRDLDYLDDEENLLKLSADLHLEKANICIDCDFKEKAAALKIVHLLQQLHSVKFLTLNLELVKFLSSYVELISHQPSPFANLKSLKIYPVDVTRSKVTMSDEVKKYLLDGSPDVTLTMVSRKEIRVMMNVTLARNLMSELQMLLDQWKENRETNTAHVKHDTTPMKYHFHERMTRIESYWEDLNESFKEGRENTHRAISMLREIEGLLKKVSRSHRPKLLARYVGLRTEAEPIMYDMMDRMKIQCDKRPSR